MKKERSKFRIIGRWGVWVCTFLVLVSIPVSVWVQPMVMVVGLHPNHSKTMYGARLVDGRLVVERDPVYFPNMISAAPPKTTWTPYVHTGVGPKDRKNRWWPAPSTDTGALGSRGWHRWVEIPMVNLAVLMVAWSGWLVRGVKRRRRLAGCCVGCGYSLVGLEGGVCPECGGGEKLEQE